MDYKALRESQRSAAKRYADGGAVHSDAAQDKKMIDAAIKKYAAEDKKEDKAMMAKEDKSEHMKRGGRLDKKARSPKKESVKVNIINVPKSDGADPMAAAKEAAVLRAAAPASQAPMAAAAQVPPSMPSRMPPMRKCGGRMK